MLKLDKHFSEKFHVQQERPILRPRRRAYVQLDRNLSLATEKLQQGRLSIEEFLTYTGHLAYDSERRRNNISYEIPQIPEHPVNIANDEGFNRQNQLQGMILEQQNRTRRMATQQENALNILIEERDFVLPEEDDPSYIAIAEIEERRLERDMANIPQVPINMDAVEPRPENCCVICLTNINSRACIPCGHKCLCLDCSVDMIQQRCHICNLETTNVIQIF